MIHPMLSFQAGGEFLCAHVCAALQEIGYKVSLASDVFRANDFEGIYGVGDVFEKCEHIPIPPFKPILSRLTVPQRLMYARKIWPMFSKQNFDIAFSTQSSPFILPQRVFHFVYSVSNVYSYPPAAAKPNITITGGGIRGLYLRSLKKYTNLLWNQRAGTADWFFAIGSGILEGLRKEGYQNSSLAFPPCRVDFKPKYPKKKQVVQAARLIPDKRLELYFEIALKLPEYRFFLIGRDSPQLRRLFPGYSDQILSKIPSNVTYIDSTVRQQTELLEESKVYMYTGNEPGIGLALVEGLSAGCMPFSPPNVGARDILDFSGVGVTFDTSDDAVHKLRSFLEQNVAETEVLDFSQRAQRFSPEAFHRWIRIVASSNSPKNRDS